MALIGFTMADAATAAWPSSYTGITMTNDAEGDMHVGLTAVPRSGGRLHAAAHLDRADARADQLYIVIRQVTSATLTRTACDQASGSATFTYLNNHVVGCHVMGGSDCMPDDINFIDNEPRDLRDHRRDRPDQGRRGHRDLRRRAGRAAHVEAVQSE